MNRSDFTALITDIHLTRCDLILAKGHDYATKDILSNFKRVNILCKTLDIDVRRSPWDCAMFLKILKIDRWCNLVNSGKTPKNESIKDTVCDEHNYTDLAYACEMEEKKCHT